MRVNVKRAHFAEIAVGAFVGVLVELKDMYVGWRSYARTVKVLNQLNDSELADIGMNRGDIRELAYKSAYKNKA